MAIICLNCYKEAHPSGQYLTDHGLFNIGKVDVGVDTCEICGKEEDCIDDFYDKVELHDLFSEKSYVSIQGVLNLKDFTETYKKALEGKNLGIFCEEIPESERDEEYFQIVNEVKEIEAQIQADLTKHGIRAFYYAILTEKTKYEVVIEGLKIHFKSEKEEKVFDITPSEQERYGEALYDRDLTPITTLNLFLSAKPIKPSVWESIQKEGIYSDKLDNDTIQFSEIIDGESGETELWYNKSEDEPITLRNFEGRPFKLLEWCRSLNS